MAVQVLIPTPLQKFTNDEASVSLEAGSVDELLQAMEARFPGILARLCDDGGKLRRFLNDPVRLRVFNVTMAVILVATLYPIVFAAPH